MKNALSGFLFLAVITLAAGGCGKGEDAKEIDLAKREPAPQQAVHRPGNAVRIAVGAMITPKEGFAYYRRFLDYVSEKIGIAVEFVDKENYAEINKLIKENRIDVAFVCSGPYVDGQKEFGMELLAAPQAYGETVYYSYIIVRKDDPVKRLTGLRGKTFAFTDPLSNTGRLVPTYMLARMNETPDTFFRKHIFTYGHDKSIRAVADGIVDGAAVDSLIWEYAVRKKSEYALKTRVIEKSSPSGIPPVVARKGLDPALKERIRMIFLDADKDPKGKEILAGMMIDRFVPVADRHYDSIRDMKRNLKNGK